MKAKRARVCVWEREMLVGEERAFAGMQLEQREQSC